MELALLRCVRARGRFFVLFANVGSILVGYAGRCVLVYVAGFSDSPRNLLIGLSKNM